MAFQVLSNLGFSGIMGAIAGITLKKVGQVFAVLIGLCFCALQVCPFFSRLIYICTERHCFLIVLL